MTPYIVTAKQAHRLPHSLKLLFAHALEHFSSENTPSQVTADLVGLKRFLTNEPGDTPPF